MGYVLVKYLSPCGVTKIALPLCTRILWSGTQKLFSGADRSAQTRQVHINSHAYTCIHHRIQLEVGDMTMSGWKPTISLIPPYEVV